MGGESSRGAGRMWRLAVPMILSNLTVPLVGMVDTAVVGRIGVADIGAVAVGATVFSFLFWTFAFVRMGTTGFAAQAHGAGDAASLADAAVRAFAMALAAGLALLALAVPVRWAALLVIGPGPEVAPLADLYIAVRMWSAPAVLVNFAAAGWLLGAQRAGLVLAQQVVVNALNAVLTVWLGAVLGLGIAGVAWASVAAEWAGVLLAFGMTARIARRAGSPLRAAAALDLAGFRRIARVNADIFLRTLLAVGSITLFTAVGARMGELVLAANGILFLLQTLVAYGLDGFAHAAEALVGTAFGRRDRAAVREAVALTTKWAAAVAVVYTAAYALAGQGIVALLSDLPEVRAEVRTYLPWAAALPLVSVWGFQLDGIFIGATRTRAMLRGMAASALAFALAVAALVPAFGNHGLWGAYVVFMVARAVTLGAAYPALERAAGRGGGARTGTAAPGRNGTRKRLSAPAARPRRRQERKGGRSGS